MCSKEKERKEAVLAEVGKFFIDISKLVFGGIILASIMKLEVNKPLLFILGGISVVAFAFAGLAFIALSKSKE
ncbi:ABC transporter permease [Parabacteroides sp. An277]|nr:ABC transporter permease [Parabacteroides sp. An277]